MIGEIKERMKTVKIGMQNHLFDDWWLHLLELKGPTSVKIKKFECISCKLVTFQNEKQIHWCTFCGGSVCKECLHKQRPYPKGGLNSHGH